RPVVDEMLDRDALGELLHTAVVVAMPVRNDQLIDLREAGILGGLHDARGVTDRRLRSGVAGVDEQRFTRWRDEERRVAALDVHHVNVERRARLRAGWIGRAIEKQRRRGG